MRRTGLIAMFVLAAGSILGMAAPLATSARSVIPKEVQQIICVDYRTLQASPSASELKQRVVPAYMRTFESALQVLGLNADKDIDTLTFAAFRGPQGSRMRLIGIAQGQFSTAKLLQRYRVQKIRPIKYRDSNLYPSAGMQMSFLDASTILFGDSLAIREALDARDGYLENLAANSELTDLLNDAEDGPVWSVLDRDGTQSLMRSALGGASSLANYDTVKKRLLGSRYTMAFSPGVKFELNVVTSDSMTASTLSGLMKAGMMYRRLTAANSAEKLTLDDIKVDSDNSRLRVQFKASDDQFRTLLQSELFAAVSR